MVPALPPLPIFNDRDGSPLDAGYLYFGAVNQNPETNPITVYWDEAGLYPAAQPVRTLNGYASRNGTAARLYTAASYSLTMRDKRKAIIHYLPDASNALAGLIGNLLGYAGAGLVGFSHSQNYAVGTIGAHAKAYVSVKDHPFLAKGDGVTDDTAAIQAAINYVQGLGGGEVFFPRGTYIVNKLNPSGSSGSNPNDYALLVNTSGVSLKGERGASRIKALPSSPGGFILMRVYVLPIVANGPVDIQDFTMEGMELDGSSTPHPTTSVNVASTLQIKGVRRCIIKDCFIHHSSGYGIGLQNGGFQDCILQNLVIEDTQRDAIDLKDNNGNSVNNVFDNITLRRFSRVNNPSAPASGLDLMGRGLKLSNIYAEEFGDLGNVNSAIRFKQPNGGGSGSLAGDECTLTNFKIVGSGVGAGAGSGIEVRSRSVTISNGVISDLPGEGIQIHQNDALVSNVSIKRCGTGIDTVADGYATPGDGAMFSNIVIDSCTGIGLRFRREYCSATQCRIINNAVGIRIENGATFCNVANGTLLGNTIQVQQLSSTGVISRMRGFTNEAVLESSTFAVDSTGMKTVTIAHGLSITPVRQQCQVSLFRNSTDDNWTVSRLAIHSVNATDVVVGVNVNNASSPGQTGRALLLINATTGQQLP